MKADDMMDNILQGDEFDMDLELFELRKQYNEMKRERVTNQKNVDSMENKIKLLENEETCVKKTLDREINNKITKNKKMAEISSSKEEIIKAKMLQQMEIEKRSEKMSQMREKIQNTLKSYHSKVAEKNHEEAQKQKMIREEILELKK